MLGQRSFSPGWLRKPRRRPPAARSRLRLEELEPRTTPSAFPVMHPFAPEHAQPLAGGGNGAPPYYPADISGAYQFDQIVFHDPLTGQKIVGDGTGQTIAIVDAGDSPTMAQDLANFDAMFNLPPPPSFQKVNWAGQPAPLPPPVEDWALEIALDVEWAHALAPGANIILFEAATPTIGNVDDLGTAVQSAANPATYVPLGVPAAGVISNSYGGSEFSSEAALDYLYTTSDNHATFTVSTGDSGAPGEWPAYSPDVLAVGGTSLYTTQGSSGTVYDHENGWSGGGGGVSIYEPQPAFQSGLSYSARSTPDVSMDADVNTGVYVILGPTTWQVGGTSLSAPLWAALLADTNQGRALNGLGPIGNAQTLVYSLPKHDFHDITVGNNGFAAGPGYDLVTGIGSPIANLVAKDLVNMTSGNTPDSGGHSRLHNESVQMVPLPVTPALATIADTPTSTATLALTSAPGTMPHPLALTVTVPLAAGRPPSLDLYAGTSASDTADELVPEDTGQPPGAADSARPAPMPVAVPDTDSEGSLLAMAPAVRSYEILAAPALSRKSQTNRSAPRLLGGGSASLALTAGMALIVGSPWNPVQGIDAKAGGPLLRRRNRRELNSQRV
jgi:hypothetical protein